MKAEFPILDRQINGEPLIYLDSAATSQKPHLVLERMMTYYQHENANIHRGVYHLAQEATQAYEEVRQKVAGFLGAQSSSEIIFNSGTTSGLNFLAQSLVEPLLEAGDQILVTRLEHHSNLVPWQELAKRTGASLEFMPLLDNYQIDLESLDAFSRVKILAVQSTSNVVGQRQPIKALAKWAHQRGALIIVDAAQTVAHDLINLVDWDVDALCFSGHKMYGPTGVGVTYLKQTWHETCRPFFYGGEMIHYVGDEQSTYKESPWKFEGGTPPIAQVIGLGAAIDFLQAQDRDQVKEDLDRLTQYLSEGLSQIEGITIYGAQSGIVSFNFEGIHPHDAATAYDLEGIALRAGHHCAQPLMRYLGIEACLRASLGIYTTQSDLDRMISASQKVKEFFDGFR